MTDEESKKGIAQWLDRLHDAFDHNGILGGKFLFLTTQLEEAVGQLFVQKYHGHRVLTDAFLDFFAESIQTQLAYHSQAGWPPNEPKYAFTFLMYLTMFRTVRATEVLSAGLSFPSWLATKRAYLLNVLNDVSHRACDRGPLRAWLSTTGIRAAKEH